MFCWEVGLQLYVEKLLPGEEAHLVEYFLERVSGGRAAPFFHSTLLAMSASSSSWRFTFYLIAFIAGTAVIVDVSGDYLGRASGGVGSLARWGEAQNLGASSFNLLLPFLCRNPGSMT